MGRGRAEPARSAPSRRTAVPGGGGEPPRSPGRGSGVVVPTGTGGPAQRADRDRLHGGDGGRGRSGRGAEDRAGVRHLDPRGARHRAGPRGRRRRRSAAEPTRPGGRGARHAGDRRPPLRQLDARSGERVLQRRDDRRGLQHARTGAGTAGRRADLRLRIQGQGRRRARDRRPPRCEYAGGRQRAQDRQPYPPDGAAHRRRGRLPSLVRDLRTRHGRRLRAPGGARARDRERASGVGASGAAGPGPGAHPGARRLHPLPPGPVRRPEAHRGRTFRRHRVLRAGDREGPALRPGIRKPGGMLGTAGVRGVRRSRSEPGDAESAGRGARSPASRPEFVTGSHLARRRPLSV